METRRNVWVVVLGAGDGTRLRSLTTDKRGVSVPKQFCAVAGRKSMLRKTLERASRIASPERIVTIVAAQHRQWWRPELSDFPNENIVVQPVNRGTAAGILLPLLWIYYRDPHARIVFLPSDHFVADEDLLQESVEEALPSTEEIYQRLVLLGMEAEGPDTGYGWIVPAAAGTEDDAWDRFGSLGRIDSFVEKPPIELARELYGRGALWNSFISLGAAATFLAMFRRALPDLLSRMIVGLGDRLEDWTLWRLAEIYRDLPSKDFSRDLLERVAGRLWVARVPACGWSDLGTPERLTNCLTNQKNFNPGLAERLVALPEEEREVRGAM